VVENTKGKQARNWKLYCLRPRRRAKLFAWSQRPHRRLARIRRLEWIHVPPPRLDRVEPDLSALRVLQGEEDEDDGEGDTCVQSSGKDVVVLGPPREVTPTDNILEDEPDDGPGDVVDGGGGGDEASTAEDDGEVEVAHPALGPLLCRKPGEDGGDEADDEEQAECVVHLALGELPGGTDDSPDDGGRAEDSSRGADEAVLLVIRAHALDVAEHPGLDAELDGAGEGGADDLTEEHGARWDFHVVAELEVRREGESLSHGNVSPGLEHHHRHWATRESVPDDKLGDDVQADLLVGDSLDHADGDHIEERDNEGEDEPLDGELGVPDLDTDNTCSEHGDENDRVPPLRHLLVPRHEPGVNVGLFVHCAACLPPDLLAVEEESVGKGGGDGGEGETIGECEDGGEEEGTVFLVLLFVE